MDEQKSFKERVKETVIYNARLYKRYYVDYEYLICSKSFLRNEYYIISAHEDNYLHLTGLHTSLGASKFLKNVMMEHWKKRILILKRMVRQKAK